MKKLLLLLLIPVAFADTSATISVHVPSIEKFATTAALKKAGIAKLKPAQMDALNDIIDAIALQVAQDTANQIADELLQDSKSSDQPVKATRIRYQPVR